MWRPGPDGSEGVICIACGTTVQRDDAREYDKHGDRWDRRGKEFEHLCKPCHRDMCHQPRGGLEDLLVSLRTADSPGDTSAFVDGYYERLEEGEELEES